ncbi:MAG: hypothetical protein ACK4KT_00865 [Thermaurantimonas sp.]
MKISALLMIGLPLSFAPNNDNSLILRLNEGQTVKYSNRLLTYGYSDEALTTGIFQGELLFNQNVTITKSLENGYQAEIKLLRVKFKQESPRWSMDYDSDRTDAAADGRSGMMAMFMNSLLQETYMFELSKTGKITKRPKIQTPDGGDLAAGFSNIFIELPGRPVRIGDNWINEIQFRNVKFQILYTVTSVVNGLLELDTEVVGDDVSTPGKTYIDPSTGLLVKSEFETVGKQFNQMSGTDSYVKTKVIIQLMP